ncbi:MAG: hypothetical protein E7630_02260 [Ruminococcaceae bacterium]|nr:hypothetical protein [Oscillospiraceae bacterium]
MRKQTRSVLLLLCAVLLLSFTVGCQGLRDDRPLVDIRPGTDESGSPVSESDGSQGNVNGAVSDRTDLDGKVPGSNESEEAPPSGSSSTEADPEPPAPVETDSGAMTSKETETEKEKPEETTPVTDAPDDTQTNIGAEDGNEEDAASGAELLVGTWSTVKRFDYGADGASLLVYTICFKADGTGIMNDLEYTYYADNPDGDWGDGWSLAGRGYVPWYFTYSLEGDELIRTTIPVEEWDVSDTSYDSVSFSERDKLTLNGMTYLRGEYDVKTLCSLLNVDYTVVIPAE